MLEKWMSESSTVTAQGGEWAYPTAKTGRPAGLKLGKFSPKCGRSSTANRTEAERMPNRNKANFQKPRTSKTEKETDNHRRG